jgi:UDP-glucose 4-epimerase
VGDVADALIKLVDTPAAVGQIFNLGHYEKITILELAQMIKELTQTSSSIQFVPYDVAYGRDFEDMMYRLPDISKIEKLIGYKPTKNLPEILQSVIEFYRSRTLEKVSSF